MRIKQNIWTLWQTKLYVFTLHVKSMKKIVLLSRTFLFFIVNSIESLDSGSISMYIWSLGKGVNARLELICCSPFAYWGQGMNSLKAKNRPFHIGSRAGKVKAKNGYLMSFDHVNCKSWNAQSFTAKWSFKNFQLWVWLVGQEKRIIKKLCY